MNQESTSNNIISDLTSALAHVTALLAENNRKIDELTRERDILLQTRAIAASTSNRHTLQDIANVLIVGTETNGQVNRYIPETFYNTELFDYALDKLASRVEHLKFERIICAQNNPMLYGNLANKLKVPISTVPLVLGAFDSKLFTPPVLQPGERVLIVNHRFTTGKTIETLSKVVTDAGGVVVGSLSFIQTCNGKDVKENHNTLLAFHPGIRSATLDPCINFRD